MEITLPNSQGNQSFRSVAGKWSNGRAIFLGDPGLALLGRSRVGVQKSAVTTPSMGGAGSVFSGKVRGGSTAAEKRTNRKLARIRVNVEHALAGVKRSRIVKDVLRNTKDGVSDSAMEAACGLHNLRVQNRRRPLRR